MVLADEAGDGKEGAAEGSESEGFGTLLKFTAAGFAGGLGLGWLLDWLGYRASALGSWLVRTMTGEGESLFEGIYSLRQRLRKAAGGMAEAYGWGKVVGMTVPWFIDLFSRIAGIDINGVQGFYIPYFYAMSDQIGANLSCLLFFRRKEGSWGRGARKYARHPVMLASLLVVLLVPGGLLAGRLLGFSPTTQTYTALEVMAANLCWVPPLVGWLAERKARSRRPGGRSAGCDRGD